ncbi:hypothetical protein QCA50_019186 [Cerrena zonata]|uniref:Uncharacterized protein n=1 Tax=Cerrena zonata TaxID=2478898 RepID=A0AAW0FI90_9APHY
MFFSAKLIFPVFAAFSIAATAFASPAVAPVGVADIAKRQSTDVVNDLQSFQSTVTPLIDQLSQAAATGSNTDSSFNQLTSAFTDSTNHFKGKKPGVIADVDVVIVVDVVVDIVLKLVVVISKFPLLDVFLNGKVDVFLSAWLSALEVLHPGIGPKVGKGIPTAGLSIFALLKLVLSAKVLAIVDILGIVVL